MGTVRLSWGAYGISKKRYKELKELCCIPQMEKMVEATAAMTCPFMWEWMVESITKDKAYELVEYDDKLGRIPCGKSDFYGYRRRVFYNINESLKNGTNYSGKR